jgi:hypothetical protein
VLRFIKRFRRNAPSRDRYEWNKAGRAIRSITETAGKREAGMPFHLCASVKM